MKQLVLNGQHVINLLLIVTSIAEESGELRLSVSNIGAGHVLRAKRASKAIRPATWRDESGIQQRRLWGINWEFRHRENRKPEHDSKI